MGAPAPCVYGGALICLYLLLHLCTALLGSPKCFAPGVWVLRYWDWYRASGHPFFCTYSICYLGLQLFCARYPRLNPQQQFLSTHDCKGLWCTAALHALVTNQLS